MVIARSMRYPTQRRGGSLAYAVGQIKDIPGVSRVILFGAYAGGACADDNDIDIAVFYDTNKNGMYEEYRRLAKICQHTALDIQMAVFIHAAKTCLLDEYHKLVSICRQTELDIRLQVFHDYDLNDPSAILEDIVTYGIDLLQSTGL